MKIVDTHEAKKHLSRLVQDAQAGEEVVIARRGQPDARLVALNPSKLPRKPGGLKDRIRHRRRLRRAIADRLCDGFRYRRCCRRRFVKLLIAQALSEGLHIVAADPAFAAYRVAMLGSGNGSLRVLEFTLDVLRSVYDKGLDERADPRGVQRRHHPRFPRHESGEGGEPPCCFKRSHVTCGPADSPGSGPPQAAWQPQGTMGHDHQRLVAGML